MHLRVPTRHRALATSACVYDTPRGRRGCSRRSLIGAAARRRPLAPLHPCLPPQHRIRIQICRSSLPPHFVAAERHRRTSPQPPPPPLPSPPRPALGSGSRHAARRAASRPPSPVPVPVPSRRIPAARAVYRAVGPDRAAPQTASRPDAGRRRGCRPGVTWAARYPGLNPEPLPGLSPAQARAEASRLGAPRLRGLRRGVGRRRRGGGAGLEQARLPRGSGWRVRRAALERKRER